MVAADVVETVLAAVAEGPTWKAMVAGCWRDGETVVVVRREATVTPSGNIHAFRRIAS